MITVPKGQNRHCLLTKCDTMRVVKERGEQGPRFFRAVGEGSQNNKTRQA